ncbi:N-acetylneuraminate synthase [Azospirillum soli]|uniref:N-acetylneuraminate synthase n=1 Tax=Azospirillum soli TaxID=1304799 RepID=UPI0031B806A4|nr:N-acetylneuraminate synthase [Azospirillum soli]
MTSFVLVIAEAGVNHNGDLELAHRLVDVAADAGADIVKFQTFRADRLASGSAPKADYQRATTDGAESQRDMLRRLELTAEAHLALQAHCAHRGIEFLSTPFDEESADFLLSIGIRRIKVPSGEVVNLPFLEHLARTGLPMLLSTGMADLEEVAEAVNTVRRAGTSDLTVLQCTTDYPARPEDANLRAMASMASAFGVPVGFSDHTLGIECALAAVALGAVVIEKHVTLDCGLPGPDHAASLEPKALAALVRGIRTVEAALGDGIKRPAEAELRNRAAVRKSLAASRDLPAGHRLEPGDIVVRRPGTGLAPALAGRTVGKALRRDVAEGMPFTEDDLA